MTTETPEPDQPVRWIDINGKTHTSPPGTMRTFSLNSDEFYEALATPRERPWIPNGALPREPRVWERRDVEDEAELAREWLAHVRTP